MRKLFTVFSLLVVLPAVAATAVDTRYCATPETVQRDADGSIHRSAAVLVQFKAIHPCPANGKHSGACPGWAIDHTIPLACGGCDAVSNLQWLPNAIKSTSGTAAKDRWERKVYCTIGGTALITL